MLSPQPHNMKGSERSEHSDPFSFHNIISPNSRRGVCSVSGSA